MERKDILIYAAGNVGLDTLKRQTANMREEIRGTNATLVINNFPD